MSEKHKFILILISASIIGIILGWVLQTIIIALIIYILWLLKSIYRIKNWFNIINIDTNIPDISEDFNTIFSNIIKLEKSIKQEKKQHKKTISRFNEILRSFPYPIIITNAKNEIVWASKSSAKMLGLNRKKDIGIKIDNLIRDTNFQKNLSSTDAIETQIISPTDERTTLMIAISKVSKNTRIFSIRDVSGRIKLENTRKSFIANASHELRTPLTVISGYIQILQTHNNLDNNQMDILNNTYKYCQKIESLIIDLLNIASLESDIKKSLSVIDMSLIITDIKNNLSSVANSSNRIVVNIDTNLKIKAIESQIYSIVFNLVENALKYSKDEVEIHWEYIDNYAVLKVIDKGSVIDKNDRDKILEPFYRLQQNTEIDGTGLGLAIVHQAVINNNAILRISDNNQGNIFEVVFSDFTVV